MIAEDYAVASLQLQMSLLDTQPGRNVAVLAFGDATLTNQVPVRPTLLIESTGVLNIRAEPRADAAIIADFPLRTSIRANGRYTEGGWLRVAVPDSALVGWVSLNTVTVPEAIDTLNIVDIDTPFLRPFQLMSITTGQDDAPCEGAPPSGVLIQSPNTTDAVAFTIDGIDIQLSGTLFLQRDPNTTFTLRQIDGQALVTVGTNDQWLVSGAILALPAETLTTTPYAPETLTGLPLNTLNYRVRLPDTITQADITARIADLEAEPVMVTVSTGDAPSFCRYIANRTLTLYAGPGTFHEIIRDVTAGTQVYPVFRLSDSDGTTWWQLNNSHWMLASGARSTGSCGEIPVTQVVQAPTSNTLVLETCDTTNGPIRSGQWVQIEFTPPSWRTLGEAQNAPTIASGQVTINQQNLWVSASSPVQVSEESFLRTFSANWLAEAGTFRITGSRLSYSLICDVTVPLG
ncbi:MAG: SH3 domain-containing protein [Chloroflexota bacterium]